MKRSFARLVGSGIARRLIGLIGAALTAVFLLILAVAGRLQGDGLDEVSRASADAVGTFRIEQAAGGTR